MAKYLVLFSCGHEEEIELFGNNKERQKKIAYYEQYGDCSECRKAARAKEAEEIAKNNALPKITGVSEKQIAYAEILRANTFKKFEREIKESNEFFQKETDENKEVLKNKLKSNAKNNIIARIYYYCSFETNASKIIDNLKYL